MPINGVGPGRLLAALILGALSPWVGVALTALDSGVVLHLMQALFQASAGLDLSYETKRIAVHVGAGFLWSLAFGFVFGLPLGFFAAGRVWIYWAVFAAGAVVAGLLWCLAGPDGIGVFFANWSYPEQWLELFAVAGFAYIGAFVRDRVDRQDNAARYRHVFAVASLLLIGVISGVGWYLIESSG